MRVRPVKRKVRVCCVPECGRAAVACSFCSRHYQQVRLHGHVRSDKEPRVRRPRGSATTGEPRSLPSVETIRSERDVLDALLRMIPGHYHLFGKEGDGTYLVGHPEGYQLALDVVDRSDAGHTFVSYYALPWRRERARSGSSSALGEQQFFRYDVFSNGYEPIGDYWENIRAEELIPFLDPILRRLLRTVSPVTSSFPSFRYAGDVEAQQRVELLQRRLEEIRSSHTQTAGQE